MFSPMFSESEGGVEFDPEEPVRVRGVDGGDGEVVGAYGNKVILQAGCGEGVVGEGEGVALAP
jgi:hypothetical protein